MQVPWEELFGELDREVEAEERAELAAEVAERTRREHGEVRLLDRLRALTGAVVHLDVIGAGPVQGTVEKVGADWLLLRLDPGMQTLVALHAVVGLRGATRAAQLARGGLSERIGLTLVLRRLARERREVLLTRIDAGIVSGTIDRVGADYLEIAEHPAGEPRRPGAVRAVRLVPMRGVALVRVQ